MTLVSGMTAFYMFRLYYVIFWGQSYYELDPEHRRRPQEVPFVMWGPLVLLAIISCVAGWIPFGHFVSLNGLPEEIALQHFEFGSTAWFSLLAATIGFGLATWMYAGKKQPVADALERTFPEAHKAALNRFYIDDAWQFFTHKIVFGSSLFQSPGSTAMSLTARSTSWLGVPTRPVSLFARGRAVTCASMQYGSSPVPSL